MKLRTGFVHPHSTPVENLSIQRSDGSRGFSGLCHLNKSDTAGLARVPVHDERDGFDGSMDCKSFPQLLLGDRDIQVADKNVSHEFVAVADLPENQKRNLQKAISRDRLLPESQTYSA